jgi:hypothetical protein
MAHAIRGEESRRHSQIQYKAILFWSVFALLGIGGCYTIDHTVDPSADLANLALPNDGQLEGSWVSGPLRLKNSLNNRGMFGELWQSGTRAKLIASFQLARGAKQSPIGFRHIFAGGPEGAITLSLDGSALTLTLPTGDGLPARHLTFHRA